MSSSKTKKKVNKNDYSRAIDKIVSDSGYNEESKLNANNSRRENNNLEEVNDVIFVLERRGVELQARLRNLMVQSNVQQ